MDPALLTIAHGTRNPAGAEEADVVVDDLRRRLGVPVANAWLEGFSEPDAVTAAHGLIAEGATALVTIPYLVLGAGHAKTDVPEAVAAVRATIDVPVAHGRVLDLHPRLFDLATSRVAAARAGADLAPDVPDDEALLVTGAGSSDPDANGDLAKIGRVLAERTGHRWVDVAWAGVTWPRTDLAMRRLAAAGARRITRFSWTLLAGVLEQRSDRMADDVATETGVQVVDAGRLGPDPVVGDALIERYHEAIAGDARMNCDLCQYRLPYPGREDRVHSPSAGGTGERVPDGRPATGRVGSETT